MADETPTDEVKPEVAPEDAEPVKVVAEPNKLVAETADDKEVKPKAGPAPDEQKGKVVAKDNALVAIPSDADKAAKADKSEDEDEDKPADDSWNFGAVAADGYGFLNHAAVGTLGHVIDIYGNAINQSEPFNITRFPGRQVVTQEDK